MTTKTITTTQSTSASYPSTSDASILAAAKGSGIKFFGMLFAYIVRFVLGILMARLMGVEQYGLYSLADTTSYTIGGLARLGLTSALVRYISIFAGRRDKESLWGTLQVGLGAPFVVSVLAGACLLVFAGPFARVIFHEPRLVPVLRVAALAIPFGTLIATTAAATRGFNRMQYEVIAQDISFPLIKLVVIIALAMTGLNAVKAMTAHAVGTVVGCVMLFYFLYKLFPLNRPWSAARRHTKEIFVFSAPLYASTLIGLLGGNLETFFLGALGAIASVGIFTVAARVNLVSKMFCEAVDTAAMPIVSELYSKGEHRQLGHFYQSTTKWTFTSNVPLFLIILLFSKPILSVFGEDFVAGSTALLILSCGSLVTAGTGINGVMIAMTGNTWLNTVNTVITLAVKLTLSFLLIPSLGVIGAALAMTGAWSVLNLARTLEIFILFRLLPYNKNFVKPIVAGAVAAGATYAMAQWVFVESNLVSTVLNISCLMAVYAAMILLLGLSEEDRTVLIRLRGRLKAMLPG
jgi:O-antigen/teichoic acid export membrane protein